MAESTNMGRITADTAMVTQFPALLPNAATDALADKALTDKFVNVYFKLLCLFQGNEIYSIPGNGQMCDTWKSQKSRQPLDWLFPQDYRTAVSIDPWFDKWQAYFVSHTV